MKKNNCIIQCPLMLHFPTVHSNIYALVESDLGNIYFYT